MLHLEDLRNARLRHEGVASMTAHGCAGMFLKTSLIVALAFFMFSIPMAAMANECDSSTATRRLNIDKSQIEFETVNEKQGRYVATLKNGDLVMASFQQCGLGMHAHFYSRNSVPADQMKKTMQWFLAAVAPSQAAQTPLDKQLQSLAVSQTNKPYTLTAGSLESHTFEFKSSESPLYRSVLHYRWNPPQH